MQQSQQSGENGGIEAEIDIAKYFRDLAKRHRLESAPDDVLSPAIELFRPAAETKPLRPHEILANLIFDSFVQPAFSGARGESAARQMLLRAEEFDIHIRIWTTENGREMLGQIQYRNNEQFTTNAHLCLFKNDGEKVDTAELDDLGEFHFTRVPVGLLDLQVELPHLTVIGALNIGT